MATYKSPTDDAIVSSLPKEFSLKKGKTATIDREIQSESPYQVRIFGVYDTSKAPDGGGGDALHSFQSRKGDKFGGRMNDAIIWSMIEMYEKKLNPFVKSLSIKFTPSASSGPKVEWEAILIESPDGKAYMGFNSRGGAGGTYVNRAASQTAEKKKALRTELGEPNLENLDVLDYLNTKGAIRQLFWQYTKPKAYPAHPKSGTAGQTTTATSGGNVSVSGSSGVSGSAGSSGSSGSSGNSGSGKNVPKITLKKKSGPGEIIGLTEKEVYFNESLFRGLQFDQPGEYVISVIPSASDVNTTEWKVTVKEDPNAPQEPKATEEEKIEGSRPIITQVDKPAYKLEPIEFDISPDQKENIEIAASVGYTPFFWYLGYQIPPSAISNLNLYHTGIIPQVVIVFRDTIGFLKKEAMPLDNTTFEVFLNSGSDNLKSIHLKFKLVKFQENKGGSYTITGTLDLKDFYKPNYKSYTGTSLQVLRDIAKENELGFNTNIESTDDSMKWTNTGKLTGDFINEIIKHSYISDSSFVGAYIDFYYCLNYVDLEKEWTRDISKDICILSTGVSSDALGAKTPDEGKTAPFILTNDKSQNSTPLFIQKHQMNNDSTSKSLNEGQFKISKFYDTSSKSFLIFNVDSLTSESDDKIILKGSPSDKSELETNFRTIFSGRVDMENVHKNYLYAETQNKTNFANLSRISMSLELPNANFTMYKFQKLQIRFIAPAETISQPDTQVERISGEYMVVDIDYTWSGGRLSQKVLAVRKELNKTTQEKENQTTDKKPEEAGQNENPVTEQPGGVPNKVYAVGEFYRAVDKSGREFSIEIKELSDNGIEVTADVIEIPKPPPEPPKPAETAPSSQTSVDAANGTTNTGDAGSTTTSSANTGDLSSTEKKVYDFIRAKKDKGHSYLGYKVYDAQPSDIKKLGTICKKYGIPLEWAANLINHESAATWNPAIQNGIGATGLIQFLKSTAKNYNTTTSQLAKMTFSEQLDYVDEYLNRGTKKYRKDGKIKNTFTQTDLFMTIFYPAAIGKSTTGYKFPANVPANNPGVYKPNDYTDKACASGKAPFPPSVVPHDLTAYVKKFGNNDIENTNVA